MNPWTKQTAEPFYVHEQIRRDVTPREIIDFTALVRAVASEIRRTEGSAAE